jgi:hypothetical protein
MKRRFNDFPAHDPVRRRFAASLLFVGTAAPFLVARRAAAQGVAIEVWTGPACSCCHDWIDHLNANGFVVTSHDGGNLDARTRLGIPVRYGSCHTAEIDGYGIEGHVPAREIHSLLEAAPDALGLSVPAMPRGSPGMDGPAYGGARDPYDVYLIERDGSARVFESYR